MFLFVLVVKSVVLLQCENLHPRHCCPNLNAQNAFCSSSVFSFLFPLWADESLFQLVLGVDSHYIWCEESPGITAIVAYVNILDLKKAWLCRHGMCVCVCVCLTGLPTVQIWHLKISRIIHRGPCGGRPGAPRALQWEHHQFSPKQFSVFLIQAPIPHPPALSNNMQTEETINAWTHEWKCYRAECTVC